MNLPLSLYAFGCLAVCFVARFLWPGLAALFGTLQTVYTVSFLGTCAIELGRIRKQAKR